MEILTSVTVSNHSHAKHKHKYDKGLYPQIAKSNRNRVFRDIGKQRRQIIASWLQDWMPQQASTPSSAIFLPPFFSSPQSYAHCVVLTSSTRHTQDFWVHDDGASVHITNDINSFFRYRIIPNMSTVSTGGGPVRPTGIGYIKLRLLRSDDSVNEVLLENVLYMPTFPVNLYSGFIHDLADGWDKHRIVYNSDGSEMCQLLRNSVCLRLHCDYPRYSVNHDDPSLHSSLLLHTPVPDHIFPAAIHEAPITLELLHRRLGHISFDNVKHTMKHSRGLSYQPGSSDEDLDVTRLCDPCEFSKPQKTIRRYPREREIAYGDRIYTDVFFCNPSGYNKHTAGMIFTDGKTGARWGYTFAEKGDAYNALVAFTRMFKTQNGYLPKCFRLDGGREFGGDKCIEWCKQFGIHHEPTSANFHEQCGPQERANRTVLDPMRCIIADMKIPLALWPEVFHSVIFLLNRISTSINDNMTPYEAQSRAISPTLSDERHLPDLSHIRVLGCRVLVYIPDERRVRSRKMDLRAEEGILLGFEGTHIFRCWIPGRAKGFNLVRSSHVRFFEGRFREISPNDIPVSRPEFGADEAPDEVELPSQDHLDRLDDEIEDAPPIRSNLPPEADPLHQPLPEPIKRPRGRPPGAKNKTNQVDPNAVNFEAPEPNVQTRAQARKKAEAEHMPRVANPEHVPHVANPVLFMEYNAYLDAIHSYEDPQSYKEALASEQSSKWQQAVVEELAALEEMNTWEILPRSDLPVGRSVIPGRWVFRTKRGVNREITRYKGRYVAKGYKQEEGVDFFDTFASTAMGSVWRALLALAAFMDWEIDQADVITAFLNPDVDTDLWVACPEGLKLPPGANPKGFMCKLRKSLYGLKQSPHLWQSKLKKKLRLFGFTALLLDPSIYYNPQTNTYLVTHVDDFLLIGPKPGVASLLANLQHHFRMIPMGPAEFFVGVRIVRNRAKRSIRLHQDAYLQKIIDKFGFSSSTPVSTPMLPGQHLLPNDQQASQNEIDLYSSMVGSAGYAAIQTRPDIAYTMSQLSRFLSNPSSTHMAALRHLYKYLHATNQLGLLFGLSTNLSLHGYTDSDYAQDPVTRRSQGGWVYFFKGGCFCWKSYLMKRVTDSSTMAEVYAMATAAKQAIFLRNLFASLDIKGADAQKVLCYYDNQPGFNQVKGQGVTQRSKHYDVPLFMLREFVDDGFIDLQWVSGLCNAADGFTKALSPVLFKGFVQQLGMGLLTDE